MAGQKDDLRPLKSGAAILAVCIVQTLNESDHTFQDRFLKRLGDAYREIRDDRKGDSVDDLELLSWTRELLTGFNIISGQGKPFLS